MADKDDDVKMLTCPECGGDGYLLVDATDTCPDCDGAGVTHELEGEPPNEKEVELECLTCDGSGEVDTDEEEDCDTCGGSGKIENES
jgi:DnaJ-class molecular chaperone